MTAPSFRRITRMGLACLLAAAPAWAGAPPTEFPVPNLYAFATGLGDPLMPFVAAAAAAVLLYRFSNPPRVTEPRR
ncbi:MAG: hypothetical protein ACXU8N_10965 [Telluria sp.]